MKWGFLSVTAAPVVFWATLAIGLFLVSLTSFWELRRTNRKRLIWRLLANGVATFSLMAMALQPEWLSSTRSISALLVTPGADSPTLKSLADSLHNASRVFAIGNDEKWRSNFPHLENIPDAAYLKRHFPEINFLHLAGHGLHEYEWDELDSIQIQLHTSSLPLGIKHLTWPREITVGQVLQVQGTFAGLDDATYWLYLADPGGVVDSTKITGPNEAPFKLSATPRTNGKFLYVVRLKSSAGKILLEEQFDVIATKPQPLKILILTSAASFETKYLKNWAGQNQNVLAMRLAISRERYRFEFLNQPQIDLNRLTPLLLRQFDLVLMDGNALRTLTAAEREALRSAVAQESLGMLLMPDDKILANNPPDDFFLDFAFEAFPDLDQRIIKPRWPESLSYETTAIPAEPFIIKPTWGMKPLIYDEIERLLAAAHHRGNGLIGVSLIRDSYRWILEGKPQFHAAYWSHLLSALARKNDDKDQWNVPISKPIIVDQPLALAVETGKTFPIGIVTIEAGEQDSIYLQQEVMEPRRWHATFWPRQSGWHQIALAGGEPRWFYVYEKTQWATWQAAQKIAATQQQAVRYASLPAKEREQITLRAKPISLVYFFVLFLLSSVYLWLERKL